MAYFFYNTDADSLARQGRYPVLIQQGFAATSGPYSFGEQLNQLSPEDTLLMYENRVGIVAVGRVRDYWDQVTHRPAIYYQPGDEGFEHEYRIGVDWHLDLSANPVSIGELRERIGYNPLGAVRRIVAKQAEVEQIIRDCLGHESSLTDEVKQPHRYFEGATRRVFINAYERNREAVLRCKGVRGTKCAICGFDFGMVYGSDYAGFIRIHHLKPLSKIGCTYVVDPVADLCPVCPNCHAVIHYRGTLRSIEDVKQLLESAKPT